MIQVYNYLQETRPVKRSMIYPVKNRKELKKVYDDIVRLSIRSPFYKINLSNENQDFTIRIKETALELKTMLMNIQDSDYTGFMSKAVSVSDNSILSARLLNDNTQGLPEFVEIRVDSLAEGQINKGRDLMNVSNSLPLGEYTFNLRVDNTNHLLTYIQKEKINNKDTLHSIAELINQSELGIIAVVEKGEDKNYSRLKVFSDISGRYGERSFTFEDLEGKLGLVDLLALDRCERAPSYANFDLNGMEKRTATNTFTLENTLHITLNNRAEQSAYINIIPDSNKILSVVDMVLSSYNSIIDLAKDRIQDNESHYSASRLISEMKQLVRMYEEELTACGIEEMEDGILILDDSLAFSAAEDGGMEGIFTRENGFITKLIEKAEAIAINPMEYLDKIIIFYPDAERNTYCNPYVTSMYSGLFFSSYC